MEGDKQNNGNNSTIRHSIQPIFISCPCCSETLLISITIPSHKLKTGVQKTLSAEIVETDNKSSNTKASCNSLTLIRENTDKTSSAQLALGSDTQQKKDKKNNKVNSDDDDNDDVKSHNKITEKKNDESEEESDIKHNKLDGNPEIDFDFDDEPHNKKMKRPLRWNVACALAINWIYKKLKRTSFRPQKLADLAGKWIMKITMSNTSHLAESIRPALKELVGRKLLQKEKLDYLIDTKTWDDKFSNFIYDD